MLGSNDRKQIDNNYLTVLSLGEINEMKRDYKDGKIDSTIYLNWKSWSNVE